MNRNLWVTLEQSGAQAESLLDPIEKTKLAASGSRYGDSVLTSIFAALGIDEHFLARSDFAVTADVESEKHIATECDRPWILHVDDDLELSNAIKIRLEAYGVSVIQALTGAAGIRNAVETPAAAILLDYEMPLGDGRYVLTQLKMNPLTSRIPVIILTGHRNPKLKQELLAMGAAGFLSKPVPLESLLRALSEFVELKPPRGAACLLT